MLSENMFVSLKILVVLFSFQGANFLPSLVLATLLM